MEALILSYDATHRDGPSFPTRRSSDLVGACRFEFTLRAQPILAIETVCAPAIHVNRISALGDLVGRHSGDRRIAERSEEHTSELQSRFELVCRLLLEKKKTASTSACML